MTIKKPLVHGLPGDLVVKSPPVNEGESRDAGSIPGLGRSPGVGNDKLLQFVLSWKIPWMEEPRGLQSMETQRIRRD